MEGLLKEVLSKEPKTVNNWRDVMVDCQTRYVRYYMHHKDYSKTAEFLEKSQKLAYSGSGFGVLAEYTIDGIAVLCPDTGI